MARLLLGATILLVMVHEVLALRSAAPRRGATFLRRLVLALLVGVAAFGGDVASVGRRFTTALQRRGSEAPPVPFDTRGDALLARRLSAQAPAGAFPAGGTREAVEAWRQTTVERLRAFTGFSIDPETHVESVVVAREQLGSIRRTLLTFTASDGTRIPAYVHEPVDGARRGGVLVVPGHGNGVRSTAGITRSDYQHAAALALAREGYVTLTPELRGFGMLTPDGVPTHRAVAFAALESGTSYKAVVVKDLARALTVLGGWPSVDPGRLGVAGASLGGELAVLLGVLDPRVRVVVSQSYGGAVGPTGGSRQGDDGARQTPHGCHTMPGVNAIVWQEDWFRLLAPRPVLVSRGERNTPPEADAFVTAVRPAFEAAGAGERFVFRVEEGGHEFFVAPAVRFLEAWL